MFTLKRCGVCRVGESFCICSVRPSIELPFDLVLLSNPEEFIKPTNTAQLIATSSPQAKIIEWKRKEPSVSLLNTLKAPEVYPFVLNPIETALTFAEANLFNLKKGSKITLILLDGTWKQSRKMYSHSDYLKNCPALKLETTTQSEYQLRNQSDPFRLSTVETVIEALHFFRAVDAAKKLSCYFKVFQWAYLHSKMNKQMDFNPQELYSTFEDLV